MTALYRLHPRQTEAMKLLGWTNDRLIRDGKRPINCRRDDAVEELTYGGAAGGGKSHLARALATTIAVLAPGSVSAIFRRVLPELEESIIRKWRQEIPEGPGYGRMLESKHEFRWDNGSVTVFRYCEREGDVFKYLSAEWDALIVDEATTFTEFMLTLLRARVRSSRPYFVPTILYTTNPGNVGHTYIKREFVEPARMAAKGNGALLRDQLGEFIPTWQATREHGGRRRAFLPSLLSDNPSLSDDYANIVHGIADEATRKAWELGDWDVFAGQFFTNYDYRKHIVAPFDLPKWWDYWGSLDWGYAKPLSYGVWARDPDQARRVYKVRELYAKELTNDEACHRIKAINEQVPRALTQILADPSMWIRKSNTGKSTADEYAELGVMLSPANNDRINGWQITRSFMSDLPDGKPGLQIFSNCYDLIRTLPEQQHAKVGNVEDLNTDLEDHAVDEMRYALSGLGSGQATEAVSSTTRAMDWMDY